MSSMTSYDWYVVIALSVMTASLIWIAIGTKRMEDGVRKVLGLTDEADK